MANGPSPLVGYNNNVRHKGKLYHIQTEDSGITRPHIITHLFADGGRIVASKKTTYTQHLDAANLTDIVRKLMQEQHKAMAIGLRDGVYDATEHAADPPVDAVPAADALPLPTPPTPQIIASAPELDLDALERAAEAKLAKSAVANARRHAGARRPSGPKKAESIIPPPRRPSKMPKPMAPVSTQDALRAKSLDEVILSYLADEPIQKKR
jgi:hypothetical protein